MQPCEDNAMIQRIERSWKIRYSQNGHMAFISTTEKAVRDIWEWCFRTVMRMVESYHNDCWSQMVAKLMQHNLLEQFGEKLQVWRRTVVCFVFCFLMIASRPGAVSFRRGSRLPPWTAEEQTLYFIFLLFRQWRIKLLAAHDKDRCPRSPVLHASPLHVRTRTSCGHVTRTARLKRPRKSTRPAVTFSDGAFEIPVPLTVTNARGF